MSLNALNLKMDNEEYAVTKTIKLKDDGSNYLTWRMIIKAKLMARKKRICGFVWLADCFCVEDCVDWEVVGEGGEDRAAVVLIFVLVVRMTSMRLELPFSLI